MFAALPPPAIIQPVNAVDVDPALAEAERVAAQYKYNPDALLRDVRIQCLGHSILDQDCSLLYSAFVIALGRRWWPR